MLPLDTVKSAERPWFALSTVGPFHVPFAVVIEKLPLAQVVPTFTIMRSYQSQVVGFDTTVKQDAPFSLTEVKLSRKFP
jgi:hypothetical protein